jgi:hypothetical protein
MIGHFKQSLNFFIIIYFNDKFKKGIRIEGGNLNHLDEKNKFYIFCS